MATQPIVVGVDFNDVSEHALEHALELAVKLGAEVVAVHAYEVPAYVFPEGARIPSPELASEIADAAQRKLDALVGHVRTRGVPVTTRLVYGSSADAICTAADDVDAAMIVLGTHGRGLIARALLGSVTANVTRVAHRPVLVVPPRKPAAPPA